MFDLQLCCHFVSSILYFDWLLDLELLQFKVLLIKSSLPFVLDLLHVSHHALCKCHRDASRCLKLAVEVFFSSLQVGDGCFESLCLLLMPLGDLVEESGVVFFEVFAEGVKFSHEVSFFLVNWGKEFAFEFALLDQVLGLKLHFEAFWLEILVRE